MAVTRTVGDQRAVDRLALVGVFGGLFAGYMGLTAVIPVLPGLVRDRLGAPDYVVGLVITATALTALLTRPVAGRLADQHGRKLVMRAGALIVGGGGALYFLPLGVTGLIAVRLLLGVGEAALFTAGAVWTVSLAPHNRRGQLIGLYGVSMWGGISLGTLLGATLQRFGYDAVWAFSTLVPLAGLALISAVPERWAEAGGLPGEAGAGEVKGRSGEAGRQPGEAGSGEAGSGEAKGQPGQATGQPGEAKGQPGQAKGQPGQAKGQADEAGGQPGGAGSQPERPAGQESTAAAGRQPAGQRRPGVLATFVPRPVVLPGTALALAAAGYSGLAAFVILMLRARGIGSGVVVLSGFSAVYAGTRLFIGHLPDTLGPRRVAAWCGAGEAAGLLVIAVAPDLAVAIIGSVVMGMGFSLLHPSLALMVMNRTDQGNQGAALGAYTSFWDLGIGVWGPLTGLIATGLGYQAVFVVGAACAAAASALALWIDRPSARPVTARAT
ncbi:MAG TPA: MFS transporter [Streptosporangiaceae bacterium]